MPTDDPFKLVFKLIFAFFLLAALISLTSEFVKDQTKRDGFTVPKHTGNRVMIGTYSATCICAFIGVLSLVLEMPTLGITFYMGFTTCILVDRFYMKEIAVKNKAPFIWGSLASVAGAVYTAAFFSSPGTSGS